jgi:hypothetical protein
MASRGPIQLVASNDVQEAQAAALPAACTEQVMGRYFGKGH